MNEIKKFFRKFKVERIVSAILTVVIGILFIAVPKESMNVVATVSGIILIICGVSAIISFICQDFLFGGYLLITGISFILCGIFFLVNPDLIYSILRIVFGIYIIVDGAKAFVDACVLLKVKARGAFLLLCFSILTIILGAVVMFSTFEEIMMFIGICLIIDGVFDLIEIIAFSRHVRDAKKALLENHDTIYM